MSKVIMDREYSDESLIDLEGQIADALSDDTEGLPRDEYGFIRGIFHVRIEWRPE